MAGVYLHMTKHVTCLCMAQKDEHKTVFPMAQFICFYAELSILFFHFILQKFNFLLIINSFFIRITKLLLSCKAAMITASYFNVLFDLIMHSVQFVNILF